MTIEAGLYYNLRTMIYPLTIDLVRHGTTSYNEADRMQGHVDIPLSQTGRQEIDALARRLQGESYDLVVHSPLTRAAETAQIIAAGCSSAEWKVYPEFIEIDLGLWEGQIYTEMVKREGDYYQRWLMDEQLAVPGGESFAMVAARAEAGVARLKRESARHILICGHATINRAILAALMSMPLSVARRFRMKNGAWSRFVLTEQGGRLRAVLEHWNLCGQI